MSRTWLPADTGAQQASVGDLRLDSDETLYVCTSISSGGVRFWTATGGSGGGDGPVTWDDVTGKPATFPPEGHTHPESDVTGLTADLAGKAATVHTHVIGDTTGLQSALDGKAAAAHTHPESEVTNLVTDLAAKAALSHTHAQSDVTGLVSDLAGKAASTHDILTAHNGFPGGTTNFLRADGAFAAPPGGGGAGQLIVPFHADGGVNCVLTNYSNAEQFFGTSAVSRNITRVDLTNYTQYRLVARIVVGSASVNSPRIYAQFHTAFSTTAADYSPLGSGGDVTLSLTTVTHLETAWTNLAAAAIADVFLTIMMNGGDGVADPALGLVSLQFR